MLLPGRLQSGLYGFPFGTLPIHSESGEERFTVEYDPADGAVTYEIDAFARGRHPLVRAAYPLMRYAQIAFGKQSVAAMRRAVTSARG